ncbi:neuronal acetylcholine receptor subunit alpha-4-like [Acanthaster planci]|uniref:Neuronal acetylcholine receptor subunit alpha-4-like n=1 Tax=Acanthaster planci TaxID=133434 RepID=A0A8B7ZFW4_ACAPL|nr:neuronal acetylcholine receptor subunit alpha-4-like [Acanthaster planci]
MPLLMQQLAWILLLEGYRIGCLASEAENNLHKHLFNGSYNTRPLPVVNASDILTVFFDLAVTQIVDVDEKNQVFTSKVWMKQVWTDPKLHWNPEDFEGIKNIKVPTSKIWIPDILIYNNADGPFGIDSKAWANIAHNGTVTWFPPVVYRSSCKINVRYYPFDEQNCTMKFGSWTYDGGVVDLVPLNNKAGRKDYWENGEWQMKESPCIRHVQKYLCCEYPYIDITCSFILRRKPLYYFAYLLLPCGLISFNTVLVFYLPPDISEKMSLCTSVLLSMAVFLLLVTQQIPANATDFPLIVKYLLFTMVVVSSSIVFTVFILNIRFRSPQTHTMPKWVRWLMINTLPKYLGIKRPERYSLRYRTVGVTITRDALSSSYLDARKIIMENKGNNYNVRMRNEMENETETESDSDLHQGGMQPLRYLPTTHVGTKCPEAMVVNNAIEEIMYLTSQCANEEDDKREKEDWKYIAMVVDRIFLIGYLCALFAGNVGIIFESPNAKEFFFGG